MASIRPLYARGVNVAAQLTESRKTITEWTELPYLSQNPIANIGCGYMQSYFFLCKKSYLFRGWQVSKKRILYGYAF